ncbi:MAG TPA: hypothetical protein VFU07_05530 [Candidatus Lumbricidophila sp.]|nr:hypothetical protein [Candidatus Lumbricidophila sp.]
MATQEDLDRLAAERAEAENLLDAQLFATNALRAAHARALLEHAFPKHSLAVFVRHEDERSPRLYQLLCNNDDSEDLEIDQSSTFQNEANTVQKFAVLWANLAIEAMGSDEDIWLHLDQPETHQGWSEFNLPLNTAEPSAESDAS